MLLMAERGDLPRADHAIFADTGWEPPSVYRWLGWLEGQTSIPIHRVTCESGTVRDHALGRTRNGRFATLPMFLLMPNGEPAHARRQCTSEFKLEPILRKVRDLVGLARGRHGPREVIVHQWIGISLDEVQRMKPSRIKWIKNVWPLVDLRSPLMTRASCLAWWRSRGLPEPPKSACIGCPYHSDAEWRRLRDAEPEAFADAVEVDRLLRVPVAGTERYQGGMVAERYLHHSRRPLADADLRSADEKSGQLGLWGEECEGLCGL